MLTTTKQLLENMLMILEVWLRPEMKSRFLLFLFPCYHYSTCSGSSNSSNSISGSSSFHLAYIYKAHKCSNNLLNAPCGH